MWYSIKQAARGRNIIAALALGMALGAEAAPPAPNYTPLYMADFEGTTIGSTIQDFASTTSSAKTTYSNAVIGPLGGQRVVRQENQSNKKGFGGKIVDMNLGKGKEVWVRWYEYFPNGFCFANSTNGDSNGGTGKIKWMRFQYPGNSTRITLQMDATPSCAAICGNCLTDVRLNSIVAESMNWSNSKRRIGSTPVSPGQWHAIQVYMHLDDVPVSSGGKGRIRVWVDNQLELDTTDLRTLDSASSSLRSVWWGNYWNGGFPKDQHWFLDEVIITSQRPNTVDSGGRPYIDPQTRVADFGIPPNPPNNIN